MKQWIRLLLPFSLILALSACSSEGTANIQDTYSDQNSVHCTLHYTIGMEAVIDGNEVGLLEQVYTADVQIDRTTENAHLLGDMVTYVNGDALLTVSMESYSIPSDLDAVSFYRYDDMYCADSMENAYLSIVDAPLVLNLDSYAKAHQTEILYGSVCALYTGQEISSSDSSFIMTGLTAQNVSTSGCLMDVMLRVYEETSLPAQLRIDYSNLDDMDLQFTDAAGNSYKLTKLSYEVLYNSYGTTVSVEMPDGFRDAALNGQEGFAGPDLTEITGDMESIETVLGGEVSEYTGAFYDDFSDHYFIFNRNKNAFYTIATPEYSEFDEKTQSRVTFSYFFAENDFELISYTFLENTTDAIRQTDASVQLSVLENDDFFSDVSGSELQTIVVGDYEVKFMTYYYTLDFDGEPCDVVDIYSWAMAPNGTDCIEVIITEYNYSGDGWLVNDVEELQYAYAAIMGMGKLS